MNDKAYKLLNLVFFIMSACCALQIHAKKSIILV